MRRLIGAAAAAVIVATGFAAWSAAAPTRSAAPAAATATVPKLPALPSAVKSRKRWVIGIKCDFPPFGFIDVRGDNGGYEVDIARRFAELAFGKRNRVNLVCVTTPSRIPTLESGRVDIIISTLTWTQARNDQIDFSIPHYSATGRLLLPNNSPINTLADLE